MFSNILFGAAGFPVADLGNEINQSLRFRGSQNLKRTLGTPTNQNNWTVSLWIKNAKLGSRGDFFDSSNVNPPNNSNLFEMFFNGSGTLGLSKMSAAQASTAQFRDTAAWYHVVITNDGTDIEGYVNGTLVNTWSGQGGATAINTASQHCIGSENFHNGDGLFTEGYMAEFNFLDGTHLTPTSFGRTNEDGVWVPKAIAFTSDQYGNNGFRLTFDNSAGIGTDSAPTGGNHNSANNFTASGFDTTAISSSNEDNDVDYKDTPTNNFATVSRLLGRSSDLNFEQGDLRVQYGGGGSRCGMAGFGIPGGSGKWYWEVTLKEQKEGSLGIVSEDYDIENGANSFGTDTSNGGQGWEWILSEGRRDNNNTETSNSHTVPNVGDTIGFLLDTTAGTCTIEINGVAQTSGNGAEYTNIPTDKTIFPYFRLGGASGDANLDWNFGQMAFQHEPANHKNLAANSLAEPSIKDGRDHFEVLTWDGNGTADRAITGLEFQPALVWIKNRDATNLDYIVADGIMGNNRRLRSNTSDAFGSTTDFRTFTSDGFTLGDQSITNGSSSPNRYVAWCWNAPSSNTSNGDGDITTTIRANTDAGFCVMRFTGSTSAQKLGHGLNAEPEFVISKCIGVGSTSWQVYHKTLGVGSFLPFTTSEMSNISSFWGSASDWNATTCGCSNNDSDNNKTDEFMHWYIWHGVEGFSKFGDYTGNGNADGSFVHLGFKPALVVIRAAQTGTNGQEPWFVYDTARETNNPMNQPLEWNSQNAEGATSRDIDILSNGFKCRSAANQVNGSGTNYIYAAWAEHPFGGENVAPATAR